ncbi:MAG: pyruvate ferredoxin oxidoreductase [Thermoproteota archaeon]|uniref:2-oxoacid oxidoreductase (ferredoxin) n=2 Tax=Candidatus Methanodesulfokora washburnensis TaxID=2478471 RepID=A0A429GCD9_9CREN|nr:pyruvate ferredoxin oxidoreductase [Candidatus Methanodesulfokores washburnensis]RZN60206.1 MAG: pyruvate ferredoxin oxidoreductase [Candidatus Methanodesulfokores washburnensis]TDA41565.1 MAG: pyruvate ferredoxin oxidoreductase [Candidatus Korarchaeota archaeon]
MGLNGDEAVAWAVKQSNVDFVSAYPITPQTIIVERISEFVNNGEADLEFVAVESEHSALSACIGAAAAGARAFTATAANGLQLMHEVLYIAASLRLPIVMAVANRAPSGPINIHCDHNDSMGQRDSGWIQIYSEDAQEVYDNTIQAFRIAEHRDVLLPVMVMMDGFLITHTMQNIYVLPDDVVSNFVGTRKVEKIVLPRIYGEKEVYRMLNPKYPITFGPLDLYDYYIEHKMQQIEAMRNAKKVIMDVHEEYAEISGRRYGDGLLDPYRADDADYLLVGIGSTMGTARYVVDELRNEGHKVGIVRIRTFRPFPADEFRKILSGKDMVGILDRGISFGSFGQVYLDLAAALYKRPDAPPLIDFVYGLGGRDMSPKLLKSIFMELIEGKEEPVLRIRGVRE